VGAEQANGDGRRGEEHGRRRADDDRAHDEVQLVDQARRHEVVPERPTGEDEDVATRSLLQFRDPGVGVRPAD